MWMTGGGETSRAGERTARIAHAPIQQDHDPMFGYVHVAQPGSGVSSFQAPNKGSEEKLQNELSTAQGATPKHENGVG